MGVSHAESLENKAFWWGLGHSSPVSRSGFEQKRTSIQMFFQTVDKYGGGLLSHCRIFL